MTLFGVDHADLAVLLDHKVPADTTILSVLSSSKSLSVFHDRLKRYGCTKVLVALQQGLEGGMFVHLSESLFWSHVQFVNFKIFSNWAAHDQQEAVTELAAFVTLGRFSVFILDHAKDAKQMNQLVQKALGRHSLQGVVFKLSETIHMLEMRSSFSRGVYSHSRCVFQHRDDDCVEWSMTFMPAIAEAKTSTLRSPVIVRDQHKAVIPLDMYGVNFEVLSSLSLSTVSRKAIFSHFLSRPVPTRYVLGNESVSEQSQQSFPSQPWSSGIDKIDAEMLESNKAAMVLQSAADAGDKSEVDMWIVGAQVVYDPIVAMHAPEMADHPRKGAGIFASIRKLLSIKSSSGSIKAGQGGGGKNGGSVSRSSIFSHQIRHSRPTSGLLRGSDWKPHAYVNHFANVWSDIKPELPAKESDSSFLVHQSEEGDFSIKLASRYENGVVLSYDSRKIHAIKHLLATHNTHLKNNLVGNPNEYDDDDAMDASERVISRLYASLDVFDYQFIPLDVFTSLLHHPQAEFDMLLGKSLALARHSFILVPHLRLLEDGYHLFSPFTQEPLNTDCYISRAKGERSPNLMMKGLLLCAADAANVEVTVTLLSSKARSAPSRWSSGSMSLFKVSLKSMSRPVGSLFQYMAEEGAGPHHMDVSELQKKLHLENYALDFQVAAGDSGVARLHLTRRDGKRYTLWQSSGADDALCKGRGVSLYSIRNVDVLAYHRHKLLHTLLRDADCVIDENRRNRGGRVEPWNVYYYRNALHYVYPFAYDASEPPRHIGTVMVQDMRAEFVSNEARNQAFGRAMVDDMTSLQRSANALAFTFFEHNSKDGAVSASVAEHFPHASVITVTNSKERQAKIQAMMKQRGIANNIATVQKGGISDYSRDMYASPEHFNFQFLGLKDASLRSNILTESVASAQVSYFVRLSPTCLSLAMTLLYTPNSYEKLFDHSHTVHGKHVSSRHADRFGSASSVAFTPDASALNWFEVKSHPVAPFRNYDVDELKKRLSGSRVLDSVAVERIRVPSMLAGEEGGSHSNWAVVRAGVQKMKRIVQHHFRARMDGHKRTYELHQRWGKEASRTWPRRWAKHTPGTRTCRVWERPF